MFLFPEWGAFEASESLFCRLGQQPEPLGSADGTCPTVGNGASVTFPWSDMHDKLTNVPSVTSAVCGRTCPSWAYELNLSYHLMAEHIHLC